MTADCRDAGGRATVTEVLIGRETLLVGLRVSGTEAARAHGGATERWLVLTVGNGLVVDIRGYERRPEAVAGAGVAG